MSIKTLISQIENEAAFLAQNDELVDPLKGTVENLITLRNHTAGPWEYSRTDQIINRNERTTEQRTRIASNIKNLGDGVLIAAAPELLEAARNAIDTLIESSDTIQGRGNNANFVIDLIKQSHDELARAIRKAEGK